MVANKLMRGDTVLPVAHHRSEARDLILPGQASFGVECQFFRGQDFSGASRFDGTPRAAPVP